MAKPFGNPREPSEAHHEYYLVLSSHSLRYPPQYADVRLDDLGDAFWAVQSLLLRGVEYTVYDKYGQLVDISSPWKEEE